jgi:flagellar biosynthesis protein FliR
MRYSESQLLAMVAQFVWPFFRVGALFVSIPIFSGHSVPLRARTLVAVMTTLVIVPTLPPMPQIPMFSLAGVLVVIQQVLIGILFGFVLNLIFAVVVFGGQSVAYNMGLGFANLIDPTSGVQVPVIAQFYMILATLLFLSMDGHLLAIRMLSESFIAIPVDAEGLTTDMIWSICHWSGAFMVAGTLMSLPIISALLLVNLGFGVASRSAPQLNIFSVGFPVSLLVGLGLIWIGLPSVMTLFGNFMDEGFQLLEQTLK